MKHISFSPSDRTTCHLHLKICVIGRESAKRFKIIEVKSVAAFEGMDAWALPDLLQWGMGDLP